MTIGLSTTLRNARLQHILDAIDAGGDEYGGGHLLIYSGDRPATGVVIDEYENDLLLSFPISWPCGSITGGVLTFGTVGSAVGLAEGVAVFARLVDEDNLFVADLSVSIVGGAGEVKLDYIDIHVGTVVNCISAVLTEGNA